MKNRFLQITLACAITTCIAAQDVQKKPEVKYRRSSLHMVMIEDAALPKADIIKDAFNKAPMPDKYNDHSLSSKTFVSSKYALTAEEKTALGAKKEGKAASKVKGAAKGAASSATGGLVDTTETKYMPNMIEKYLNANNVAKDMVAKWFGRDANGAFKMDLISSRGSYDASALEVNKAKASARGMASIADAGEELIGNTFVVVTRFNYVSKQEFYDAAHAALNAAKCSGSSTKLKVTSK